MMDAKKIGRRIKAAREAKKLTQEQLAELVNLSPMHMSVLERGHKTPNWKHWLRLPTLWMFLQTIFCKMW